MSGGCTGRAAHRVGGYTSRADSALISGRGFDAGRSGNLENLVILRRPRRHRSQPAAPAFALATPAIRRLRYPRMLIPGRCGHSVTGVLICDISNINDALRHHISLTCYQRECLVNHNACIYSKFCYHIYHWQLFTLAFWKSNYLWLSLLCILLF